ncbi:MAG: hypothetical protein AB7H93_16735 [Vicinamibacterales bacterium]
MILDWINDDIRPFEPPDHTQDRRLLLAFVRSFDGSAEAGYLEAVAVDVEPTPDFISATRLPTFTDPVEDDAMSALHGIVVELLRAGFPPMDRWDSRIEDFEVPVSSLRFRVRSAGRTWKKAKAMGRAERRAYEAPGAYGWCVDGALTDLVPYLVMEVLRGPGALKLMRCPARRAGNEGRCGRFFIKTGRREYCSDKCKVRANYDSEMVTRRRTRR